jgi:indolepyruvate ferredoxin oxidoreductase
VAEYEARVQQLLASLTRENREIAVEIAELPEQIRGFDTVKERSIEQVREKEKELLAAFAARGGPGAVRFVARGSAAH